MPNQPKCLFCGATSHDIPLVSVTFQEKPLWICSQHLPLLIHEPQKLVESLQKASEES